jgi:hypothetical protein
VPAKGGEAVKVGLLRMQLPGASMLTLAGATSVVLLFDAMIGISALLTAWLGFGLPAPPHAFHADRLLAHPWMLAGACVVVAVVARRVARPLRSGARKLARGAAVLRSPRRALLRVASWQLLAWCCRVGAALAMLAAFGLHADPKAAVLVVVLGGMSTLAPAGGAGAQQLLVVYGLTGVASASSALTFSVGMQLLLTSVNCLLGLAAVIWLSGSIAPWRAVRGVLQSTRECAAREHAAHGLHLPEVLHPHLPHPHLPDPLPAMAAMAHAMQVSAAAAQAAEAA